MRSLLLLQPDCPCSALTCAVHQNPPISGTWMWLAGLVLQSKPKHTRPQTAEASLEVNSVSLPVAQHSCLLSTDMYGFKLLLHPYMALHTQPPGCRR